MTSFALLPAKPEKSLGKA